MLARSTPSTMQVIPTTYYEGTQSRPFAPLLPPRRPPRGPICETDAAATKLRPKGCQRILIRRGSLPAVLPKYAAIHPGTASFY